MGIILKKMETDEEIKGKAYVHWKSWHEAYVGIVSQEYLDKLTLEKCEKMAFSWPDNTIVAKENGNVIGFVCYGDRVWIPARWHRDDKPQYFSHRNKDDLKAINPSFAEVK